MELGEFADIVLAFVDRAGLADAGMGDKEGVEVWKQRPRGHQPNLLFHRRGKGKDRSPLTEDRRGMEVSGLVYEGFDPRFQEITISHISPYDQEPITTLLLLGPIHLHRK